MVEIFESEKDAFFWQFPVSRETEAKLLQFVSMLREWNERINLIAESSLPHVWSRHVLDSAQLLPLLPAGAKTLADMGSGAGFPGLVLAIMSRLEVNLIESIGKKARFLRAVIDDLGLGVVVHQERLENLKTQRFDVLTARALKPLPELLGYAKPLMHKNSVCLFLKGQQAEAELTEARKYWTFSCEKTLSLSNPLGSVLKISDLKASSAHGKRQPKH